jgi:hypothetical protein
VQKSRLTRVLETTSCQNIAPIVRSFASGIGNSNGYGVPHSIYGALSAHQQGFEGNQSDAVFPYNERTPLHALLQKGHSQLLLEIHESLDLVEICDTLYSSLIMLLQIKEETPQRLLVKLFGGILIRPSDKLIEIPR